MSIVDEGDLDEELYEHFNIVADEGQTLIRIDKFLFDRLPNASRNKIAIAARNGNVKVNGEDVKPNYKVKPLDVISIVFPHPKRTLELVAQDIPLNIIYEDQYVLVLYKPMNMVVHPGHGNFDGTLVNALLFHFENLPKNPKSETAYPGLVHRIDKDTTGLMVVAKTLQAQNQLVSQLQRREVKREYEAVVTGELVSGGTVDKPIGRHPRNRKMMTVREGGKESKTHYKIITRYSGFSHLCISLDSGRTHQIRVHMSHINYAILGDQTYSPRSKFPKGISYNLKQVINDFKRQALHAKKLELIHPLSGDKMSWTCELPEDMRDLLECLSVDG